MPDRKHKKEPGNMVATGAQKKMAKPRMSKSARIAELNLNTARIPVQPWTIMPGTVSKLIRSRRPSQPEKAQIAIEGTGYRHRNLCIENSLTDEHGDEVRLKKGAHVDVTVTAKAWSAPK